MSTLTMHQLDAIRTTIAGLPEFSKGVGTKGQPCSIAAVNLALSGELTDDVPPCMSLLLGGWIMFAQDLSAPLRTSAKWRELLPRAAGTGREGDAACLHWLIADVDRHANAVLTPLAATFGFASVLRRFLAAPNLTDWYALRDCIFAIPHYGSNHSPLVSVLESVYSVTNELEELHRQQFGSYVQNTGGLAATVLHHLIGIAEVNNANGLPCAVPDLCDTFERVLDYQLALPTVEKPSRG